MAYKHGHGRWLACRVAGNPIVGPHTPGAEHLRPNFNGPSLVVAPSWRPELPGRYLLYFADHGGDHIRVATADHVEGPYRVYSRGTLRLDQTPCVGHIASPDVHVDVDRQRVLMYYHGPVPADVDNMSELREFMPMLGLQRSLVAASDDGVHFSAVSSEVFGPSYYRVVRWRDQWLAWGMPGYFYLSDDPVRGFRRVSDCVFDADVRHAALWVENDLLHVFFSRAGDCPERLLATTIDLSLPAAAWRPGEEEVVLEPEADYEGVGEPLTPSARGGVHEPVRQLRDPAIFEEAGQLWLLYSVAGESGIAMARLSRDTG